MNKFFVATLLTIIAFSNGLSYASLEEEKLITTLYENINLLKNEKSYLFFNLHFTDREMELFEKLKVEHGRSYTLCGKLSPIFEEVPSFLRSIGNDDEEVITSTTEAVYRIAAAITHAEGKEGAWVELRARLPNHEYDIPRWHIDGYYFPPFEGYQIFYPPEIENPMSKLKFVFKFATVFKGSSTLFYNLPEDLRAHFEANMQDRTYLAEWLGTKGIEKPQKGEGVMFISGGHYPIPAGVHSEPKIDQPRLFFSVVPADENDLKWMNENFFR